MAATTGGDPEGDAVSDVIRFYAVGDEYGCFSNFSSHPVKLKGKIWPTSEHYFQAQKFAGTPDEEEVRLAKSPMIAALMGRSRKRPLRKDWESVKDSIMHGAVLAKFTQHADLRETLLGTGNATIVEHTEKDRYWGDGDGSGENRLGQILMQVREELRYGDTQGDNPAEAGL
jgi:N-glycosidase YbiA